MSIEIVYEYTVFPPTNLIGELTESIPLELVEKLLEWLQQNEGKRIRLEADATDRRNTLTVDVGTRELELTFEYGYKDKLYLVGRHVW